MRRNQGMGWMSVCAWIAGAGMLGACAAEAAGSPDEIGGQSDELLAVRFTGTSGTGTTGTISTDTGSTAPHARPYVTVADRGETSITLEWHDLSTNEARNELYRRVQGGSWTRIATLGADNAREDALQYVDEGLSPDSQYCYQMRAINSGGTKYSYVKCGYTRDGREIPVFRAQLRVKTAPFRGAGTDDDVALRLNSVSRAYVPNGNETWLDYGRNDFEEGADQFYDVSLEGIGELSDVIMLSLHKPGSDAWCIEEIALHVNENDQFAYNNEVFRRTWGSTPGTCLWLGGGQPTTRTISHAQLRAHAGWQAGPNTIPIPWFVQSELESRLESIIGDLLTDTPAYWGDRYGRAWVEAVRTNDSTLHVDLDLAGDGFGPDPEVDVDFDLVVGTRVEDGRDIISIQAQNLGVDVDFDWWMEVLSFVLPCGPVASVATDSGIPDCVSALEDYIEDRVLEQWEPVSASLDAGEACRNGKRLSVWVDPYSTVYLECVEPEPTPSRIVVGGLSAYRE